MRASAAIAIVLAASCNGGPADVAATIASARAVRGDVRVGEQPVGLVERIAPGASVSTGEGGLARIELDSGAGALVDRASQIAIDAEDAISLASGRALVEAHAGDAVTIALGAATLRAADAALSIEAREGAASAYVVRGEVSFRATVGDASQRGIVRAGEELVLAAGRAPAIAPRTLWTDWTGGVVRAGPGAEIVAPGMGTLEARVPDELGLARWALTIRRLDVRVRIEGDLAITEVEQEFFNPASEAVEGLYRVSVPEDAVLQRFAVDRGGVLVDGYVREQQQALEAYEAQVYRGSTEDPALLEWDAPGRYRARIYPIAPGAVRRIAIRYASWLTRAREGGPRLYRYPIAGGARAPHVQEMSFVADLSRAGAGEVRAGMGAVVERGSVVLRRSDFRPRADLWLELEDAAGASTTQRAYRAAHEPPPRAPGSRAIVHEADERDYWYLPLALPASIGERARAEGIDLVVVADVSAATDRSHLELGRSVVESLAAHLGARDRISVVGADLALRPLVEGEGATALGPAEPARIDGLLEGLSRVPAGGATDLGAAIAEAAALLDPARPGAVIYVGDGAPTVGELAAEDLIDHLARLPRPVRLYGIAVGAGADLDLLDALTHGGGLAIRVEERAAAAEAALRVLAHAGRPLLARVTVDVGSGIDNVFPRRPVDVALGDVLPVVGRVRDALPAEVIVRGEVAGEPFEHRIAVATEVREERTDLRLRWAGERLRRLLLEGATREEIAELGTRYGLITPYTSYYVPSAREAAIAAAAEAAPGASTPEPAVATPVTVAPAPSPMAPAAEAAPMPARRSRAGGSGGGSTGWQPEPEESDGPRGGNERALDRGDFDRAARTRMGAIRACYERELRNNPTIAGSIAVVLTVGPDGRVTTAGVESSDLPASVGACIVAVVRGLTFAHGGTVRGSFTFRPAGGAQKRVEHAAPKQYQGPREITTVTTTTTITTTTTHEDHARRRCSDASARSLDDRRALWRERLEQAGWVGAWIDVLRAAAADCELPAWRDRRALLSLILERAGSLAQRIEVYRSLGEASSRGFVRGEILRSVRSPDDLRMVRQAFGLSGGVDWALVEQVLLRATTPAARLRALRDLVRQTPGSFDLRLRLLEELESQRRIPEALRLVEAMRRDPLADPGTRTAIGELYLRLDRVEDARRAFSEIVEFTPLDELARRRLGDLYRAHGWHEDAYRQYETLASIRPDDPGVLLLLAQAAAGTGRTDEALRLEQRLLETSEPGARDGLARIAQLWSSVRFARLRHAPGADREALLARMRRSGVLRGAGDLRVTLTWAHPDAQLALHAAHPGRPLARATDLAPELGLEALDVAEQESGTYRIEVRRSSRDRLGAIDAELLVVWREGRADERIEIVPLRFDADHPTRAWTIAGDELRAIE